jgi:hypothetical protein
MCSLSRSRAKKDSSRIILISPLSADIVLIIHVFDILPRMVLRFLLVNVIQALALEELVDLSARDADEEFLGKLVGNGLSCFKIVSASVCSCATCKGEEERTDEGRSKVG